MKLFDKEAGIQIDNEFDCSSARSIEKIGKCHYRIDVIREKNVPEYALTCVFYDYSFAIRINNSSIEQKDIVVRIRLTPRTAGRNNKFIMGPYWKKSSNKWIYMSKEGITDKREYIDVELTVQPGESFIFSTKPFWTPGETKEELELMCKHLNFLKMKDIGHTAMDNPIWAVETPPRKKKIFLLATMQSAEFAADTVLHIPHWLSSNSRKTKRLLDRIQFLIIPVPNPDGVLKGQSIMNAVGEFPMMDFKNARVGGDCALESKIIYNYFAANVPDILLDIHVHPGKIDSPKYNNIKPEFFKEGTDLEQVENLRLAMDSLFDKWERNIAIPPNGDEELYENSLGLICAKYFGKVYFCYQNYCPTPESCKAHLTEVIEVVANALLKGTVKNKMKEL